MCQQREEHRDMVMANVAKAGEGVWRGCVNRRERTEDGDGDWRNWEEVSGCVSIAGKGRGMEEN